MKKRIALLLVSVLLLVTLASCDLVGSIVDFFNEKDESVSSYSIVTWLFESGRR